LIINNYQRGTRYLLILALLFTTSIAIAGTIPDQCRQSCVTPYGQQLGHTESGVIAYSNCNADCVIFEPYHENGIYTGIRWQCVEFARRWLLVNKGVVYGDVDYAYDIWDKINHYQSVADKKPVPVVNIPNGASQPPRVGDLLIYSKDFLGTGHVAVVTAVDANNDRLQVGEQNFDNRQWSGDHARAIDMTFQHGRYWVLDPYLLGWKRMQ
jgi:glutathionylspermidine amidase/synthetase